MFGSWHWWKSRDLTERRTANSCGGLLLVLSNIVFAWLVTYRTYFTYFKETNETCVIFCLCAWTKHTQTPNIPLLYINALFFILMSTPATNPLEQKMKHFPAPRPSNKQKPFASTANNPPCQTSRILLRMKMAPRIGFLKNPQKDTRKSPLNGGTQLMAASKAAFWLKRTKEKQKHTKRTKSPGCSKGKRKQPTVVCLLLVKRKKM